MQLSCFFFVSTLKSCIFTDLVKAHSESRSLNCNVTFCITKVLEIVIHKSCPETPKKSYTDVLLSNIKGPCKKQRALPVKTECSSIITYNAIESIDSPLHVLKYKAPHKYEGLLSIINLNC